MSYVYNSNFFDYIEQGSRSSAHVIARILLDHIRIDSVLDVGCGRGAWLEEWGKQGVSDICGLDGDYVLQNKLFVDEQHFRPQNLTQNFNLGRKFDLVQSLEVAEHLPESAAEGFIESLVRHGDIVIFSAATPGQGGENHINEQPLSYWRDLFARHGFDAYDFLRPLVIANDEVMEWYRYNTLIYANETGRARLSDEIRDTLLSCDEDIPELGSLKWRIRKAIVGLLPLCAVKAIAQANAWRVSKIR